ncbi:MAG TPA: hypothetical protein VEI24_08775 [Nitrospiria bacterium]|nr:hypothetical protein [Nitrospiria bacterium]
MFTRLIDPHDCRVALLIERDQIRRIGKGPGHIELSGRPVPQGQSGAV